MLVLIPILVIIGLLLGYMFLLKLDMKKEIKEGKSLHILWQDRERPLLGLPCSFNRYSFSDDRIFVSRGLFNTKEDELRLYRVLDLSVERTFIQKMFQIGDVVINSSDKTLGNFVFKSIKNPKEVKEQLSSLVERNRDSKRVSSREYLNDINEEEYEEN